MFTTDPDGDKKIDLLGVAKCIPDDTFLMSKIGDIVFSPDTCTVAGTCGFFRLNVIIPEDADDIDIDTEQRDGFISMAGMCINQKTVDECSVIKDYYYGGLNITHIKVYNDEKTRLLAYTLTFSVTRPFAVGFKVNKITNKTDIPNPMEWWHGNNNYATPALAMASEYGNTEKTNSEAMHMVSKTIERLKRSRWGFTEGDSHRTRVY